MNITDYNFDIENKKISHKITNREALKRWIQRAIMTERNTYPQFSSNYGVEIEHLKGKPLAFVVLNLQRTIEDALRNREEIENIYDFQYQVPETKRDSVVITFSVNTIYGTWKHTIEVKK